MNTSKNNFDLKLKLKIICKTEKASEKNERTKSESNIEKDKGFFLVRFSEGHKARLCSSLENLGEA